MTMQIKLDVFARCYSICSSQFYISLQRNHAILILRQRRRRLRTRRILARLRRQRRNRQQTHCHTQRQEHGQNFLLHLCFLLLWIFFAGVRCPALDRTTSAPKSVILQTNGTVLTFWKNPLQTGRVCSMMNLHIHKSSTFGNVHHSKPPPTKKGPGILRSRVLSRCLVVQPTKSWAQ